MNLRQTAPPILLLALAALLVLELPQAIAGRARNYDWFGPVIDARAILMDRYVDVPDDTVMQEAILKALAESLDDDYTVYVPPKHETEFTKELSGHYVGIGAHVRPDARRLRIISPMDDSPALEAGIRAGDLVLQIDDFDTLDQGAQACIDHLLGEPGSTVDVTVRHSDDTEETLTITRRAIEAPTVNGFVRENRQWRYLMDDDRGIAMVRVTQFTDDTVNQLLTALVPLHARGQLNGLILDLRNNPGGALPAAVAMSDLFLSSGDIVRIAATRPERADEERVYSADARHPFEEISLVALIDDQSASASEIVAGALRDNDRALIVGERSFGKGSVQEIRPLQDERGLLKFTTAHYYLPSGRNIHRRRSTPEATWGVDPSPGCIVPEDIRTENDRILMRQTFEVITDEEPDIEWPMTEAWLHESYLDPALAEAFTLITHHVDEGSWPELPEDMDEAFPAMQAQLDDALDRREALERHLIDLNDEIVRLSGSDETVERGLVGLDAQADMSGAVIVIHDAQGNPIGTWRLGDGEDLRRSLDAVTLEPVEDDG